MTFLQYTSYGRVIRGVSSNPELALILGISPNKFTLIGVGIGSVIGAIGGTLAGLDTNIDPTMGFHLMIGGFAVMILGGVGSVGGLIVASLLISVTQYISTVFLNGNWMEAIEFALLIILPHPQNQWAI